MKKLGLWIGCLLLVAAAGMTACDDDEPQGGGAYVPHIDLIGNWKVVSWSENGVADDTRTGEIWVVSKRKLTAGQNASVAYTYREGVLRLGTRDYAVAREGDDLVLRADDADGRRVVVFRETDEEPEAPVEPEEPFVAIPRERIMGVWSVAERIVDNAADPAAAGALWIVEEEGIRIGARGKKGYYEFCNTTHNLLRYAGTQYLVEIEGEAADRVLVLRSVDAAAAVVIRLVPAEMPAMYEALPLGEGAYKDTLLTLSFESAPRLGSSGKIRIFKTDGTQVDCIDMADATAQRQRLEKNMPITTAMDVIGNRRLKRYRIVHYNPVEVEGTKVVIRPHYDVLEYNTSYYVTVDREAIVAEDFEGIADTKEWTFTTKAAPTGTTVTVGAEGTDFRTIQAALDYGYDCGKNTAVTIEIRNGVYEEQLFIRYNNNLTLRGESRDGVVIRYDNCDLYNGGVGGSTSVAGNPDDKPKVGDAVPYAGGRCVMLIESCDMVRFENLTLENTHGPGSQGEALYNNDNSGNCRVVFVRCNVVGAQDTLNLKGYTWFYDCLVAGDVDFIWGGVDTALFEGCEIRAVNGGYVVQARCKENAKGFVFLGCTLTQAAGSNGQPTYLARTGGSSTWDNVTYVNCRMGSHIPAVGWYGQPHPAAATAANGWKEYNTMDASGSALDLITRLAGICRLSREEYEAGYKDRQTVFAGCSKGLDWLAE